MCNAADPCGKSAKEPTALQTGPRCAAPQLTHCTNGFPCWMLLFLHNTHSEGITVHDPPPCVPLTPRSACLTGCVCRAHAQPSASTQGAEHKSHLVHMHEYPSTRALVSTSNGTLTYNFGPHATYQTGLAAGDHQQRAWHGVQRRAGWWTMQQHSNQPPEHGNGTRQ